MNIHLRKQREALIDKVVAELPFAWSAVRVRNTRGGAAEYAKGYTLQDMGEEWRETQDKADTARERLVGAIRLAATEGLSQSEISRQTGMTRATIAKALR